jgi:hypothetical protein
MALSLPSQPHPRGTPPLAQVGSIPPLYILCWTNDMIFCLSLYARDRRNYFYSFNDSIMAASGCRYCYEPT